MKNKVLEKVDEAIETVRPIVEDRMPYRKWKMHIELLWDNTFGILFEYVEDLSDATNDGKVTKKYELSNQFWYSQAKPDIVEYTLIRYTENDKEVVKKEEISVKNAPVFEKEDTSATENNNENDEIVPPLET